MWVCERETKNTIGIAFTIQTSSYTWNISINRGINRSSSQLFTFDKCADVDLDLMHWTCERIFISIYLLASVIIRWWTFESSQILSVALTGGDITNNSQNRLTVKNAVNKHIKKNPNPRYLMDYSERQKDDENQEIDKMPLRCSSQHFVRYWYDRRTNQQTNQCIEINAYVIWQRRSQTMAICLLFSHLF